ncbi:MAG: hypothetical protein AAF950_18080 [Pseudomonadota bacterium]
MGGGDRAIGGSLDFHPHRNELAGLRDRIPKAANGVALHVNADGTKSLEFSDPDSNHVKVIESMSR